MNSKRFVLVVSVVLASAVAMAQTLPLRLPQFPNPPETNGADPIVYPNGFLWNTDLQCNQGTIGSGWRCLASTAQVDAAKADAVSQSGSALASAVATLNAAISTVQTNLNNAVLTLNASIASVQAGAATALASAVATLNGRIDTVQASIPVVTPDTVCGTATITGLSIPLTGISSATTLTVTGATTGSPCVVGGSSFLPLGAYAVCAVTAANTVQVRFQGGGLLGSVISIPNGTYKACALVRP